MIGALTGTMGTFVSLEQPGLRIIGQYTGSGGMLMDFDGGEVTLDCGQAHVKAPYTVENSPAQFLVHVQNSEAAFTLAVTPDNSLRGSGSATVNGRLVTGMNGDNVTCQPHSETCSIATLTPKVAASSSSISGPVTAPPAAPATATPVTPSRITLAISTSFPAGQNLLAGRVVQLMSERYDTALHKVGAPIPADATPGQALMAYSANCNPPRSCPALATAMHPYFVAKAMFDANGKATLSAPLPPGSYYIICGSNSTGTATPGALVWDVPITLKDGDNSITLNTANAEVIH